MNKVDWLSVLDSAIDEIDSQLDARDPNVEEIKRSRELTARVFSTDDGMKLLSEWFRDDAISAGITPESTQIGVGIIEGRRQRVREILIAIKQVREASE